ncbi:hypothetical protein Poli38472_007163 [Pythium oligandrum]|uniref:Uncharacterized protein n=1 Tax=Pythium oligandrum TaxID=41045 RepID=A0A8K1CA95_PYTOL|nr:hypothetical protein Poli38472_007163 [Pythium oligandrum]|eukprot:TMW59018.1 hypothetical protein Poli38472_007163 [Pythium oligandrum]
MTESSRTKRSPNDVVEAVEVDATTSRKKRKTWEDEERVTSGHVSHVDDHGDVEQSNGREELRVAVERHDFERVSYLHDVLSRDEMWRCDGEAMAIAIRVGHTAFITWHLTHCPMNEVSRLLPLAAEYGRLEILERLWSSGSGGVASRVVEESVLAAVKSGSLEAVRWFDDKVHYGWPTEALDVAALNNRLKIVQWLHTNRTEGCSSYAMDNAAREGHLEIVQWLHAHRTEGCTTYAMDLAAWNGHLDVVQWLHLHRNEGCTTDAMDFAASNGHLDVVQWLHANRTEGCSTDAMDDAAANGHLETVRWLHTNRTEGCTTDAMDEAAQRGHFAVLEWLIQYRLDTKCSVNPLLIAIKDRQLRIVKALYDRQELTSWPRPAHASLLFDLFRSDNAIDASIFEHVVSMRQKRYHPEAADNPYYANEDGAETTSGQKSALILPTSVSKVCERHHVPQSCGHIISTFAFGKDSTLVHSLVGAVQRGWVHWLMCFSRRPSRGVELLAERGALVGARVLHDRLKRSGHLECTKRFMYLTVSNGDLEYIKWHMLNCDAHALEEWLYVAVWTGRVGVIDWIKELGNHTTLSGMSDSRAYKMFHSVDASFASVVQRFESELMAAEAEDDSRTVNKMDLDAIHGRPLLSDQSRLLGQDIDERTRPGCTVTGICGAIINGHLEIIRQIYKNQPDLAKWPKLGDGPDVLRRLLYPVKREMLAFFRYERDMRLEPRDLDEAAFRGDTTRVEVICELDLVDLTSSTAFDIAAVRGDDGMLQVLLDDVEHPQFSTRAMDGAAEEGHLTTIERLDTFEAPCTRRAIDLAARNGHLKVIEYLFERRHEGCSEWAMYWAKRRKTLETTEEEEIVTSDDSAHRVDQEDADDQHGRRGIASEDHADEEALRLAVERRDFERVRDLHDMLSKDPTWQCDGASIKKAIEANDMEFVSWHLDHCSMNEVSWLMPVAAEHGRVGLLERLWSSESASIRKEATKEFLLAAVRGGSLEAVIWFHENEKVAWPTTALHVAAQKGHLHVVQWLHANRREGYTDDAMDGAAQKGHLEVVQWLHVNRSEGCTTWAMNWAAENGHLDVVEWLHTNRSEGCTTDAMDWAAMSGHVDVLQWLHANRNEGCTASAMDEAARNGHLDAVRWLHANRSEGCTTNAMDEAAANGRLEVVQWLHANRSEGCTPWAMNWAAANGYMDVVQWLHANRREGCTTGAMDGAAQNGHLNVVQWLHANRSEGCTTGAMNWAAENGHFDVLEWLIQHRSKIKCSGNVLRRAIQNRQLRIVKALYDRDELKSWPRPAHADLLFDLFRSENAIDVSIFERVVSKRQQRYRQDAADNPYAEHGDDVRSAAYQESDSDAILPTSVSKVCEEHNVPNSCGHIISDFAFGDDSTRVYKHEGAVQRARVHWLFCFSERPGQDMALLAESGNLAGARLLHDRLECVDRLKCSKRFMYLTVELGDLEYVKWHMLKCEAHSFDEWLYAAVWVGRADVISWMRQLEHQPAASADPSRPHKMFHSLDASFTSVAERFESEVMAAEAANDSRSINMMDLYAIRGERFWGPIAGITVTGLYGAIVNGYIKIVRQIYTDQPSLANWPKLEDGPEVLRRILSPDKKKMLAFFRHERGMRLEPQDLDKAAIQGDLTRVVLIRELKLVESTSNALVIAAVRGDETMLEALVEGVDNPRYSTQAMDGAAEEGFISMVEYLHTSGAPCTRRAIDLAARNGHEKVVEFLFENRGEGCSEWAIYWASACGHASIVRYLTLRGVACDVDESVTVARQQGYHEIVDILESYRVVHDQAQGFRCSSRYVARCRRQAGGQLNTSPSHVVYRELERELWSDGLPHAHQPAVLVPPLSTAALELSADIDAEDKAE